MASQLDFTNDIYLGELTEYNVKTYISQVRSFWHETKTEFLKVAKWQYCCLPDIEEFYQQTRAWETLFRTIQNEYVANDNCVSIRLGNDPLGVVAAAILEFRDTYSYYFALVQLETEQYLETAYAELVDMVLDLEYMIEEHYPGITYKKGRPEKMERSTTYKELLFELKLAYLDPQTRGIPFCLLFSGGKDSTLVAKALYEMVESLPAYQRIREVHISCVDTGLEIPLLTSYINDTLWEMAEYARVKNLPIKVHSLKPELGQRFFSLVIGLGYALPTRASRWCVSRLKINPNFSLISKLALEHGGVVTVLGVREDESLARKKSIKKFSHGELRYSPRTNRKKTDNGIQPINQQIYQPVRYFDTSTVWDSLENGGLPWGLGYSRLKKLYKDSGGECPLIADINTPRACGSRYGCYVCTLIAEDKTLKNLIENDGNEWLKPLFDFRNYMIKIAENPVYRETTVYDRSTGKIIKENTKGGFNKKARQMLNARLLAMRTEIANNKPHDLEYDVVSDEELEQIQKYWEQLDNIKVWKKHKENNQQMFQLGI